MLFAIEAILRPGAEKELVDHAEELNEFLGPSARNVRMAGALRDTNGRRTGYLAIFEGSREQATAWAAESPHVRAGLYERVDIFQYELELGSIE